MLLAICHSDDTGWVKVEDFARVSDLRAERGNLLWAEADIAHLTSDDVDAIAEEFDLHPLAVEDAIHARQRPKFESYDHHSFTVLHELDEEDGQLEASQIACFVGDRWVLTLHAGATRLLEEAKRRWAQPQADFSLGPAELLHTLLDVVVDDFESIANRLDEEVEGLEDIILNAPNAPIQQQAYSLKQRVSRLRRFALPVGRIVDTVIGDESDFVTGKTAQYFRDVHDHIQRLEAQIRNIDDLTNAVLDFHQSEQNRQLNDVMKKLTAWAAIIAVPTFIGSVYGMNFQLVPEESSLFGFWFAVILMATCSLWLYYMFKKRDWL